MTDITKDELPAPGNVDRSAFRSELKALGVREKDHTREGDAIAAARRRLPMVRVDGAPRWPTASPDAHRLATCDVGSNAFETYWTTGRGVEVMDNSFRLLDLTVYRRQETWEDSPSGWPKRFEGEQNFRTDGRPTAQWSRLNAGTRMSWEPSAANPEGLANARASHRAFVGVSALLFAASAALTILWCGPMSAMRGMPMPGGWTMSMAWMRMPGQTWAEAAASFIGMWTVMMAAMMLPSLAPMLWRYRQSVVRTGEIRLGRLTILVALGYFVVWAFFGSAVFVAGVMIAAIEMTQPVAARAVPIAAALVVLIAAAIQFTTWKAHHLACCRKAPEPGRPLPANARTAWRQGIGFGLHCSLCCANLTAVLLVLGVMNLSAMAAVTAAISAERLARSGERAARAIGFVVLAAGLILIARGAGVR